MKKRYSIFPIKYHDLWQRYKTAHAQTWGVEEVEMTHDKYDELSVNQKKVFDTILAFFLVSDGIVIDNLVNNVVNEVPEEEAQFFYHYQIHNETIHAEQYGLFLEQYIKDESYKQYLFNSIENMDTVAKKANWAIDWIDKGNLAHKLIAFAVVEGLFFSGLFSLAFYFRGLGTFPGFGQANQLIMKDEQSHYEFALHYYKHYCQEQLSKDTIRQIILDGYDVEKVFIEEVLNENLPGLSSNDVVQFIQFTTDTILVDFGLNKEFNVGQPLEYMTRIASSTRSNFFEVRKDEYTKLEKAETLFDEDF